MAMTWRPSWWTEFHGNTWERVKEAMRRDWEQTKHDLDLEGGHQLNQDALDTINQAAGAQAIPTDDRPNPPQVIGSWDEAELPLGYGYGARHKYGEQHPSWDDGLEATLRSEWEGDKDKPARPWEAVKGTVRRGYQYQPRQ